jgi:hypothetical protein
MRAMLAISRLVRAALVVVLAWQAVVALARQTDAVAARPLGDAWRALAADAGERLRAALGDDAETVLALREPPWPEGALFAQRVTGSLEELRRTTANDRELAAAFERLSARNGLLVQLTQLLLPRPLLVQATDPVAEIEAAAVHGHDHWLLVLAGDATPHGRPGWDCTRAHARFTTWRFRKGS